MGYDEDYCQLCGVSFNIKRFRTRAEPRCAAWGETRHPRQEQSYLTGSAYYKCPSESEGGCAVVERRNNPSITRSPSTASPCAPPQFDTEFLPLSAQYEVEEPDENSLLDLQVGDDLEYEHIAGPGCQQRSGYSSYSISIEEMSDCTTMQCLYAKPEDWIPSAEDMYFEADSAYYLSGLSSYSTLCGWEQVFAPVLHGRVKGGIVNDNDLEREPEEVEELGVAFHPACFELFRTVSEINFGKVNMDGLAKLRNLCCDGRRSFCDWGRDVDSCRDLTWVHLPNSGYLVANPVFIPRFRDICEQALQTNEDFDVQQSAFPQKEQHRQLLPSTDPFLKLPSELVQYVVSHLDSQEIAALRLSSRAFQHLPISLWHRLLLTEMPCIFEAWRKDVTPYTWASQDVNVLQNLRREEVEWELQREKKAKELDYEPELKTKFLATEPKVPPWHTESMVKDEPLRKRKMQQPIKLPHAKTNWYQLYSNIARHWEDLKGLKNRERIWETVYDICDAIEEVEVQVHGPHPYIEVPMNLYSLVDERS